MVPVERAHDLERRLRRVRTLDTHAQRRRAAVELARRADEKHASQVMADHHALCRRVSIVPFGERQWERAHRAKRAAE
jgi:hypothetical protein